MPATHPVAGPPESVTHAPARQVRVEFIMGTAVTIDVRPPFVSDLAFDAAFAGLRDIDQRFSLYLDTSELSRLATGAISESDLSADVRWVLAVCDDLARTSRGAFDARTHRRDGVVDPSAIVKGWAVEEAARSLQAAGAANLFVGAGGDIVTRGEAAPGAAWRIGIRHPEDVTKIAAVIELHDGAVATSGLYERGAHIVDPRTGAVPNGLLSMTVVGPDLTWADAYATTAFVIGLGGLGWVDARPGYGAIAITDTHEVVWTPSIDRRLASDGPVSGISADSHDILLS